MDMTDAEKLTEAFHLLFDVKDNRSGPTAYALYEAIQKTELAMLGIVQPPRRFDHDGRGESRGGTRDHVAALADSYEALRTALLAIPHPKRELIQRTQFVLNDLRAVLALADAEKAEVEALARRA